MEGSAHFLLFIPWQGDVSADYSFHGRQSIMWCWLSVNVVGNDVDVEAMFTVIGHVPRYILWVLVLLQPHSVACLCSILCDCVSYRY
jgi:hypothetical protein